MKSLFFSLLFFLCVTSKAAAQPSSQSSKSNSIITKNALSNAIPTTVAAVDDQSRYAGKITGSNTLADPGFIARALGGTQEERVQTFGHTIDGGYFAGGVAQSKDGDVTNAFGGHDMWLVKLDNNLVIKWRLCIGSRNNEEGAIVRELSTGDFLVAGNTVDTKGNRQILIARVSKDGKLVWQKTLGGTGDDRLASIELSDNQYFFLSAETNSNNGDVSGNHGGYDTWILKIKIDTGVPLWKKTVGGSGDEYTRTVQKTPEGGVILCAMTRSTELPGYKGETDALIAKLSSAGVQEWIKLMGNTSSDQEMMIRVRPLGDYILSLVTDKNDGDFSGTNQGGDIWVQQIFSNGALGWKNNFGTNAREGLNDLQIMADNRILIDGTIGGNILVLNISQDGNLIWQKSFGGSRQDATVAVRTTTDGGYFIMGLTNSNDGDVLGSHTTSANNTYDTWLIKLNADGTMAWNRAYGGTGQDWFCDCGTVPSFFWARDPINMRNPANYFSSAFLQDGSGNFYFAVPTTSKDGDVTGIHSGKTGATRTDIWFVKITAAPGTARMSTQPILENKFTHSLYPSPAREQVFVSFTAMESGRIIIELYTAQGLKIRSQQLSPSVRGQVYRQSIDVSRLPVGSYFYRVINGKNIGNGAFIKTH